MFQVVENKTIQRNIRKMRDSAYHAKTRVHVFQGKESILENLENRFSRPNKLYKEVVLSAYPELAGRIRWSQKAGCSCGCSPGFIVDGTVREEGAPIDIYITANFK